MATFVMVHGAWHGGWCFDTLRPLLEGAGHQMIAPDLPGMGGTANELAAVTLGGWADYVATIVRDATAPVILVGHSRGGVVISETAERVPDQIAALVYICAMLLPSGMSRDEMRKVNDPNPDFNAIRSAVPGGTVIDKAKAASIFAQLSPPDLAAAAAVRLVAEPAAPMTTMLSLSDAHYGSVSRHYIECLHDLTIPIGDQRRMQALQPCASVISLAADHSPFLSTPRELATALVAIAERANR
jgi:pimeloyl-ACP methyl ester carboxylesterase